MHTIDTTFTRKLDEAVKDQAILLLFGEVTDEQREALISFMDKKFELCHSLALYISDVEKSRHSNMSDFHSICNTLGIDPGKKNVNVNEHGKLFFTDDYHKRPVPLEYF